MEKDTDVELIVPVAFCTFNRLDTTKKVFEKIREARPTKLYLISDCAREHIAGEQKRVEEVRTYMEKHIDWNCEVKKNYAEVNMGCGKRIYSGISWVMEQEEEVIILEDDCVPDITFFRYCQEMLKNYRNDDIIMMISGNNPISNYYHSNQDYFFSKIPFVWGWATWRRAWNLYDFNLKSFPTAKSMPIWRDIFPLRAYWVYMAEFEALYRHTFNTWGYQLMYATIYHDMLAVVPAQTHVFNIGFDEEATHTKNMPEYMKVQNVRPVDFPIRHSAQVVYNRKFDRIYMKIINKHGFIVKAKSMLGLDVNKSIVEQVKRKLKKRNDT